MSEKSGVKRYDSLDLLKGIACIIVVLFHCPLPGKLGELIIYALRFPVPIFFMITGYWSVNKSDEWIKKKSIQLLKMILYSELFYGVCKTMIHVFIYHQSISEWLHQSILSNFVQKILFGSFFNGVLWYLYAAVWVYIIMILLRKIKIVNSTTGNVILIATLLAVQIAGRYYVQNHYDIERYVYLFRSAVAFGLPCTLLGGVIATHEDRITYIFRGKRIFLFIMAGNFLIIAEYLYNKQFMDYHLSTFFISTGLFLFAIMYPQMNKNCIFRMLIKIGKEDSLMIYIIHPFFILITGVILEKAGIAESTLVNFSRCGIVILCSILFAYIARHLRKYKRH